MTTKAERNLRAKELLSKLKHFGFTNYALLFYNKRIKKLGGLNKEEQKASKKAEDEFHEKFAKLEKAYDEQLLQIQKENLHITEEYKAKKITHEIYDQEIGRLATQLKEFKTALPKQKEELVEALENILEEIRSEFRTKRTNLIDNIDNVLSLYEKACHWEIKGVILHFYDVKILSLSFETDEQIKEAFGKDCIIFEIFGLKRVLFKTSTETPKFTTEEDKYTGSSINSEEIHSPQPGFGKNGLNKGFSPKEIKALICIVGGSFFNDSTCISKAKNYIYCKNIYFSG